MHTYLYIITDIARCRIIIRTILLQHNTINSKLIEDCVVKAGRTLSAMASFDQDVHLPNVRATVFQFRTLECLEAAETFNKYSH